MSEQMSLAGFEAPHAKELAAYNSILPKLKLTVEKIGANPSAIKIIHNDNYSSVWYASVLVFRIRLRKKAWYIEVPTESKDTVTELGKANGQKETSDGFWRVKLWSESVQEYADILASVLRDTVERFPKEWDCCSRYMECSDAKRCVHPDPAQALKCGYRKILASGKIYYGENRNID